MQIIYLVSSGCIKPLCDLLDCEDSEIVTQALRGLENILKARTTGLLLSASPHVSPETMRCALSRWICG